MTAPHQLHSSFVVRIWWEQTSNSGAGHFIWRGWVQHARSGEASYVQDLEELLGFIERWTGKLSTPDEPPVRLK